MLTSRHHRRQSAQPHHLSWARSCHALALLLSPTSLLCTMICATLCSLADGSAAATTAVNLPFTTSSSFAQGESRQTPEKNGYDDNNNIFQCNVGIKHQRQKQINRSRRSERRATAFRPGTTLNGSLSSRRRGGRGATGHSAFVEPLRGNSTPQIISKSTAASASGTSTALKVKCKSFDEMLAMHHHTPLLIDFFAPWCGPCKIMKGELSTIRPQLEKLGPLTTPSNDNDDENESSPSEDVIDEMDCTMEVQEEQPTGIPVFHVNANKFPQVGARNKIHGLPTLVLFYEGEEIWRHEGVLLGNEIVEQLTGLQEEGCWEHVKNQESSSLVLDEN